MANFDAAALALKAMCPTNEMLMDDKGLPSAMVYIPKFKMSDVIEGASDSIHPAFRVEGVEIPGFWVSKYQNVVHDSRAYSLPGEDPKASINFNNSVSACETKGLGWHCMTRAEWGAIALWCMANGFAPKGNNNYGKDSTETSYKAIPKTYGTGADAGKIFHVATGTGPLTWSHNGDFDGIWDLNGNVAEWMGGIRLVKGEIQVFVDNNAACDYSQAADSAYWKAINAAATSANDLYLTPNGQGTTPGSVKLDYVSNHWQWDTAISSQDDSNRSAAFGKTTCSANISATAKELLYALCLMPASDTEADYNSDTLYVNNGADERAFCAGGSYNGGAGAGLFCLGGSNSRSSAYGTVGFRSAYIDLSQISG